MMAGRWLRSRRARMALALGLLLVFVGALPPGAHAAEVMRGSGVADHPGQATGGEWVRKSAQQYVDQWKDDACYTNRKASISDGSFTSGMSWTDKNCLAGGHQGFGSITTTCTWQAPPARLKAGGKVTFTSQCQAQVKQTDSYKNTGAQAAWKVTAPVAEGDRCGTYSHSRSYAWVSTGNTEAPRNETKSEEATIPMGRDGDLMEICHGLGGPGGTGQAIYWYVYQAAGTTPAAGGSGDSGSSADPGTSGDSEGDALADDDGGGGLGDAGGGLLAILTILISLIATVRKPGGDEFDKTLPVGYVLELSTRRIELAARGTNGSLVATVYQVYHDGRTEIAGDAEVALSPPAGVGVSPAGGIASVNAVVAHEGAISPGATLVVTASTPGGGHQDTVEIVAPVPAGRLVVTFEPPEKSTLAAYGGDSVTIVGRIVSDAPDAVDPAVAEAARASIDFQRGNDWLDMSAVADWPDARAVRVMASQPDPDHPAQPPESATVTCTATIDGAAVSETVAITIARNPTLDATPDTVHFAADSGATAEVRAWIESGGGLAWSFRTEWRDGSEPLAEVAVLDEEPTAVTLQLTEASSGKLDPSRAEQAATLRILATAADLELERYVEVIVAQEGLFIDPAGSGESGQWRVDARGNGTPMEVDVRVYVMDQEGVPRLDLDLARAVEWEPADPETSGAVALRHESFSILPAAPPGIRPGEPPAAIFEVKVARPLPTGPTPLIATLRGIVPGYDGETFTALLPLRLDGVDSGPYSPDWKLERERCLYVIQHFMPPELQKRWQERVFERELLMGAEGLYALRHKIWQEAANQLLRQKLEYEIEAHSWEQWEMAADWLSWTADMAIQVAAGAYAGTVAMAFLTGAKPMIVEAVRCVLEGRDLWEFAWSQGKVFIGALEGAKTDIDVLNNLAGNRAVAWGAFIAYWTARDVYDNWNKPQALATVLQSVAGRCRDAALVSWMRVLAGTSIVKPGTRTIFGPTGPKATAPPGAKPGSTRGQGARPSAQTRGRSLADRIDSLPDGPDGRKVLPQDLVTEIMRDPDAGREMRRLNPKAYEAYAQARKAIHAEHDARLKKELESRYGWKVRIETFGTEKGIDRDYRVVREVPDPADPSKKVWTEVPRGMWQNDSYRIFSERTGGPTGPNNAGTRAAQAKHAQEHQQLATDQFHEQACRDMSDQFYVPAKNGKLVKVQRIGPDPKTGEMRPLSNLDLVESGNGRLHSGKELGDTYRNKVFAPGPDGKPTMGADSLAQARKAGHTLEAVRDGYAKQGINPGPLDPKLRQGMNIVEQGASMKWDPETTNRALQQAGFEGGMDGYMKSMGDHFTKLDRAK